jgi:membrane fusion protein
MDFFRKEAVEARETHWWGSIVLTRPLSLALLTLLACTVTLALGAILVFGSYTKRITVQGLLVPLGGLLKVHAPQAGVILEKYVIEGTIVMSGAPLYKVSSERYDANSAPVLAGIAGRLKDRRDLLSGELTKLQRLQVDERDTLASKLASIKNEANALEAQIASQKQLVAIANDASHRYQGLVNKGYISTDQFQQRKTEHLAQVKIYQSLVRERTALAQTELERNNELAGLHLRQSNQLAVIERQLSAVEQELAESEATRTFLIHAPESGVATAAFADVGHSVDAGMPLVSIVPVDALLEAELYAPSMSIGFIAPGDDVNIRYNAYPYQKFGVHRGRLLSISRTSISPAELSRTMNGTQILGFSTEQLYRLRVSLSAQEVLAYGQSRALQSGMRLEADIMQDRRRLYEWVLEPLYSLTGKI